MGAEILGVVLGGWFKYTTMVTSIKSMTLFALALYGTSFLCLMVHRGQRLPPDCAAPFGGTENKNLIFGQAPGRFYWIGVLS